MKSYEWEESAACASTDPEVFFPELGAPPGAVAAAKAICARCDVLNECREDLLSSDVTWFDLHGIRAGMGRAEQREALKEYRREHGEPDEEAAGDDGYEVKEDHAGIEAA